MLQALVLVLTHLDVGVERPQQLGPDVCVLLGSGQELLQGGRRDRGRRARRRRVRKRWSETRGTGAVTAVKLDVMALFELA